MRGMLVVTLVTAPDGRRLAVECWGAPKGVPVFMMHGTPGSRRTPRPSHGALYRLGVRLVGYDRPGYGGSDPQPGREVAHAAGDVAAIADALDLETFAVFGRSGGGPHALACAALLPYRVTRAAALVSLAPRDAAGLDWYHGMTAGNVEGYQLAERQGRPGLLNGLKPEAQRMVRASSGDRFPFDLDVLPLPDRRVLQDERVRRMFTESLGDAVRTAERAGQPDEPTPVQAQGWADDMLAFVRPWGFDPAEISSPVFLWHGARDVFSPVGHSEWLAARIPGARLLIDGNSAHFSALEYLPHVLGWLGAPHDAVRPTV